MFKTFFFQELKYVLKQPLLYIFLLVFGLMVFGAVVSDKIMIGGSVGNVHENSPYSITMYTILMVLFGGLLVAAAVFNNAALREYKNNFNEILYSTPLSKAGFFFGRFFGALLLSTVPMLGVFLGVLVGSAIGPAAGWIGADRIGPFYMETFVNNYFLFILPNMFFAGAIIYALAHKWRSTMISFVGALLIIVAYMISGTLMSDIENETIAALLDSFGIEAYSLFSKYQTPAEKNTISPMFEGVLLANRAIWVGLGALILFISYLRFSFKARSTKAKASKAEKVIAQAPTAVSTVVPSYGTATGWAQFRSFLSISFWNIVRSVVFKILIVFAAIILFVNLEAGFEMFGLDTYPVTYEMVDIINGASGLFIIIILVFFSGELIWRDRDNKINEVVDSTPHGSFSSLAAKALSLVGVVVLLHLSFVILAILYQLAVGYTRIDLNVYFVDFFMGSLPGYIVLSGVLIFIQVLVSNKYLGYFISILLIFSLGFILNGLDIESNMFTLGGGPSIRYSDMNGFGPGVKGALWFNTYWLLFSALCLLFAGLLWNRGMLRSAKERIKNIRKQMPRSYALTVLGVGVLWLLSAGFVYYNTQVLNTYLSSDEQEQLQLEYEQLYKQYENDVLPKITAAKYFVDIHPEERDVFVKAEFIYTNESSLPIKTIHYSYDSDWHPEWDIPGATVVKDDPDHSFISYSLSKPIQPGESIPVTINTKYVTKGFENTRGNTNIVRNGTFLNNFEIMPTLGYQTAGEIGDKNKRKNLGLPAKKRMPELEHNCSSACQANYLSNGASDYIPVETVISTSSDQIAIAPGSLRKEWEENGRKYFHYAVDQPSQHFFSFISARYEVARRTYNGIDIEVYHDEKHGVNVPRMIDAVERSLEYYTKNFGPYFHKQCRIIEFPRYRSFAQAFPGTMPYSESIGFIIDLRDEEDNNIVDAVIAHEMAHQWWAHQVVGAKMQGGTMLSESFAEYSSLMTMKHISKTRMKMREFLKYDHNRYLRGRSREVENELPLYKVENQLHIHYGKGSVILFALQDYIGEDKVNAAMRGFLEEYRYKAPPYPTSLDFLRHLKPQVPDSMSYLINDWFEEITLYDNRMKEASYRELSNGKYQVEVLISAAKLRADTVGNETKMELNDWIDIGGFSDEDEEDLIFEKRVKIDQKEMGFTFQLDELPARMAIDPRRLLIDRVYDDNSKRVTLK